MLPKHEACALNDFIDGCHRITLHKPAYNSNQMPNTNTTTLPLRPLCLLACGRKVYSQVANSKSSDCTQEQQKR